MRGTVPTAAASGRNAPETGREPWDDAVVQIAIPLFDQVTALDAIGPYEVLQRLPGAIVTFVGHERGVIRTDNGFLGLSVDATFDEVPSPEVVVVPGGIGTRPLMTDPAILGWIRATYETTRFTTSVCTGSLLLGSAGLLEGLTATTHWSVYDVLARTGATPTAQRVVEHLDRRIITAAGVSSGIDMALRLSALLVDDVAAKAMQLMIEYDPAPPFRAGTVEGAGAEVMARLVEYSATKR
jgi:putative intracellular protease/amidase